MNRTAARYAVGMVAVIAMTAGCAGQAAPTQTAGDPASTVAGRSPGANPSTATTTPTTAPATPSGSSPAPEVRALRDAEVEFPRGYDRAIPPGPDLPTIITRGNPGAGVVFESGLQRIVLRDGASVGALQVLRVRDDYTAPERLEFVFDEYVKDGTGLEYLPRIIFEGREVVWLEDVRGRPVFVMAWARGKTIVTLFGKDPRKMRTFAAELLKSKEV
jgi:hypothetical protein